MKVLVKGNAVRIRLVRKNQRASWLARKVSISRGYMSQLLAGSRSPSPPLRERLQAALDAEFDELFVVALETAAGGLVVPDDDVA